MTAAGLSSAAELMLNMPASDIGIKRYSQNRLVAFMVSSIGFRGLNAAACFIFAVDFMLAGSAPAVQGANPHTRQARFHIRKCGAGNARAPRRAGFRRCRNLKPAQ